MPSEECYQVPILCWSPGAKDGNVVHLGSSGVLTLDQMISVLLPKNARFLVAESLEYAELFCANWPVKMYFIL